MFNQNQSSIASTEVIAPIAKRLHTSNGIEASRAHPCPLCGSDHWCFHLSEDALICGKTDYAPIGWVKTGEAKDGRGIFATVGSRKRRSQGKLPSHEEILPLLLDPKTDSPQWITRSTVGSEDEQEIEYLYPDAETGEPLGKVIRKQWSDRRAAYGRNGRDTKEIRPWHWVEPHHPDQGDKGWWSDRGKGAKQFPLYRQAEVRDAIARSCETVVFYNAGEQAVETARQLGLTSFCNQGGEGSYLQQIVDFLSANKPKLFVICPDNDETGRKSADKLLRLCDKAGIPAIAIELTNIWADIPTKGDIKDIVNSSGMSANEIIEQLEIEIKRALLIRQNESPSSALFNGGKTAKNPPADLVGKQLAEDYQSILAFNNETATWMRYEADYPGVWSPETDDLIDSLVDRLLESKGITGYGSSSYVTNVVKSLKRRLIVRKWLEVSPKELLPYQNGVLEVSSGKLLDHAPGYRFTWSLPRQHNPLATDWSGIDEYLDGLSGGNSALKQVYLCFCNAVLKGRSDLQKFLHLIGLAGSGKGTFARLITDLIGQQNIHSSTLEEWCGNRFEPANAYKKRLVVFWDEDKQTGKLGKFLSLTGGDWLRAEEKGKKAFQYRYDGMVLLLSNIPIFTGDAVSRIARRVITAPCNNTVAISQRRDLNLEFTSELDAFTNHVLAIPDAQVTRVLQGLEDIPECTLEFWENRIRTDSIAAWVNDWVIYDVLAETAIGSNKEEGTDGNSPHTLYGSYCLHSKQSGTQPKANKNFSPDLLELCHSVLGWDIERKVTKTGKFIRGLRLRTDSDGNYPTHDYNLMQLLTGGDESGDGSGDGSEPIHSNSLSKSDESNLILLEKSEINNCIDYQEKAIIDKKEEVLPVIPLEPLIEKGSDSSLPPVTPPVTNLLPTQDSAIACEIPAITEGALTPQELAVQINYAPNWSGAWQLIERAAKLNENSNSSVLKTLIKEGFTNLDRVRFVEMLDLHVQFNPEDEAALIAFDYVLLLAAEVESERKD